MAANLSADASTSLSEVLDDDGALQALDFDEHLIGFSYMPNISITMAYGLVERGTVVLPNDKPYSGENSRSVYLDVMYEGRLVHRSRF